MLPIQILNAFRNPNLVTSPTLTFKIQSLYCAYAPDFDVCSFGGCFEEAVNSLHEQMKALRTNADVTGEVGN